MFVQASSSMAYCVDVAFRTKTSMDRRHNFKPLEHGIAEEVKKASKIGKMTVESSISLANRFQMYM